jgi:minor extracellular serine protease Vpr
MKGVIRVCAVSAAIGAFVAAAAPALSAGTPRDALINSLAFDGPDSPATVDKVDRSLRGRTGVVDVVVRLGDAPLIVANGENNRREGGLMDRDQQQAYAASLSAKQQALVSQLVSLGGREVARLRVALNAVIVSIDAAQLDSVANLAGVTAVNGIRDQQVDLSETVPYIGAAAVQASGVTGRGVRVAVIDSGIDYTHRNLGGAGTAEAYAAAWGTSTADPKNTTTDGLFPTAKVVGGYDFVGEAWPNGPRTEDPDPIDFGTHGTHVADIIAGKSLDGTHKGVAPDALLYAIKVCSAVSTSCNGTAILLGYEFAMDPNGDGCVEDAVDVINFSVGSPYGQREDDSSEAARNAVRAGIVTVVSAGNSGDRPFIVGSPSSAPEVISVAQTTTPSAFTYGLQVNSPASIAGLYTNTNVVDWAPIASGFTGDVVATGIACTDATVNPAVAGKVALVDRGTCNISVKVDNAARAGATAVLLANNAAGDAPSFSFGGGSVFVQTLVVTQATGTRIKGALATGAVNVSVSAATKISLAKSMASTSSRGPGFSDGAIKPDIGAPGASVSAVAGSGSGENAFSGTSGAAPMVAGSAALLVQKYPRRSPAEIKAVLMNTAETAVFNNPATQPGVLAPITRIGAGEVRVNRAIASQTAAWDDHTRSGSLSFGYRPLAKAQTFEKEIEIRNYSRMPRVYKVSSAFRYANDAASGAVQVKAPSFVFVGPNSTKEFEVEVTVDATKLPGWGLNGGNRGGVGSDLETVEFDGYLTIADAIDTITMPWQVLPHRSADVSANDYARVGTGSLRLRNGSEALAGDVDLFYLTGTSPRVPRALLPGPGDNFTINDLRAVGVRQVGNFVQFAINTYTRRTHPSYPGEFDIYVDSNNDGVDDFILYNAENGGFNVTGQTVIRRFNLKTGADAAVFFADADFNSRNIIYTMDFASLGLAAGTQFRFSVYAFDDYFTGALTDSIENMTVTLGTPKWDIPNGTGIVGSARSDFAVAPKTAASLDVTAIAGGDVASPSQQGFLLMYRDAASSREADAVFVR